MQFQCIFSQGIHYKGDAQIECGSFYAGLEFHHTSPVIQRVSFYYPSANSLDQSTDYWKRDSSFIMAAGLKVDNKTLWLNKEQFEVDYFPYKSYFKKKYPSFDISVNYEFMKNEPAFTITYIIVNKSVKKTFEFYTDLEASLRTSHTYRLISNSFNENEDPIQYINYDNIETQRTSVYCINDGEKATGFSFNSPIDSVPAGNSEWWKDLRFAANEKRSKNNASSFQYIYRKELNANDTLRIIQIIGTAKLDERKVKAKEVYHNYQKEVKAFEEYVLNSLSAYPIHTNDNWLDNSIGWAQQILSVNQHYIDGTVQPMPCPAEYNFFFSHDVLLTDLSAVNFDLSRVKKNLSFIASHSRADSVIPHAYYWKDSAFVTEYADPDNWNHFWFIITSSKYLLHSNDISFIKKLYPLIYKSVNLALSSKKGDLMYAKRPDWWDIGNNYGARSYMTILAIKAIKEFVYISSVLNKPNKELIKYSEIAKTLQNALNDKLWVNEKKFLFNKMNDDSLDFHYYIGSLLANHFNAIDDTRKTELVKTASEYMLNKQLGIYNAFPMDFHKLIDYYKFNGDEAGAEFYYMNGGIWSQGNAWYALALASAGKKDEALSFVKNIMTIDGIISSPNGQPAMYEVRIADYKHKENYGKIDKPQFMWYAGWYLYTLYNMFCFQEEEWNITLDPWNSMNNSEIKFNFTSNSKKISAIIKGKGDKVSSIKQGNKELYSLVLPTNFYTSDKLIIQLGKLKHPMVKSADCKINDVSYDSKKRNLTFNASSFKGKFVTIKIISPGKPVKILQNGKDIPLNVISNDSEFQTTIQFIQSDTNQVSIKF